MKKQQKRDRRKDSFSFLWIRVLFNFIVIVAVAYICCDCCGCFIVVSVIVDAEHSTDKDNNCEDDVITCTRSVNKSFTFRTPSEAYVIPGRIDTQI